MSRARVKALALATALVLAGAVAGCGDEGGGGGSPPRDYFGINGVVVRAWSSQGRDELVERHLASIEEAGIKSVRAQLGWQQLEPAPPADGRHAYDFADADRWVAALARHGLRWYVFGVGIPTPEWAAIPGLPPGCATRSPPARPTDFAAVMAAIAKRYGRGGSFWNQYPELPRVPVVEHEVWNAPNHGGDWCPQPDPAAYARLYAATHRAVHAADPEAEVIVGGLGTFPRTRTGPSGAVEIEPGQFLAQVLAAVPELRGMIDAVGVHVYAPNAAEALGVVARFAARLDQVGLGGVPISWNEVGWATAGGTPQSPATPEEQRAAYIGEIATTDLTGCGVSLLAPHTWVSEERFPANPEEWFGIADPLTANPYPSGLSYAEAIRAADAGDTTAGPCSD